METLFIYLLKASGLTLLFFMAYYFFLRRETFFTGNRWFLLAGLFTSVLLPLALFTKTVWVTPAPVPAAEPLKFPAITTVGNITHIPQPELFTINWLQILLAVYCAGLLFFMAGFIYDIFKIVSVIKKYRPVQSGRYKIIDSEDMTAPFSFFRYIVFNSAGLQPDELRSIINHEKIHSRQWHSLDITIAQLFCIVFWCNPFIWLYKKAIAQNLEFIADEQAIAHHLDRTQYQKTLLKFTIQPNCIAVINHFNQPLIKKRIFMLNKKPSERISVLKYVFILPVLCLFIYAFQTDTVTKQRNTPAGAFNTEAAHLEINKDITNAVLKQNESFFKSGFNTKVTFSEIERNKKGEITRIRVKVTDGVKNREFETESSEPITPFYIVVEKNNDGSNEMAIGKSKNIVVSNEVSIPFNGDMAVDNQIINVYGRIQYVSEKGGNFKLSNDGNSGFVVTMKTTDENFKYYKQQLKDIDIELRYSEIKRDKKGNIQYLRMDVIDTNEKSPFKISMLTETDKGDKGIDDIYIGRRDGTIIAGNPNS